MAENNVRFVKTMSLNKFKDVCNVETIKVKHVTDKKGVDHFFLMAVEDGVATETIGMVSKKYNPNEKLGGFPSPVISEVENENGDTFYLMHNQESAGEFIDEF